MVWIRGEGLKLGLQASEVIRVGQGSFSEGSEKAAGQELRGFPASLRGKMGPVLFRVLRQASFDGVEEEHTRRLSAFPSSSGSPAEYLR